MTARKLMSLGSAPLAPMSVRWAPPRISLYRHSCRIACFQTHGPIQCQQLLAHHPQIGQRIQRMHLRRVLRQTPIAQLQVPELALDHPEGMPHFGADASLEVLQLIEQSYSCTGLVQREMLARAHGHVPACLEARNRWPLGHTLVAGVSKNIGLLAANEAAGLGDLVDVGSGAHQRINQSRVGVCADVALYATVPLVAVPGLVHLGVSRTRVVLGGTGCRDQRAVDHGAGLGQQSLGRQHVVDGSQYLWGQLVAIHRVVKPEDGATVGHALIPSELGELAEHGDVVQRLFYGRVAERESLLHEVHANHGDNRKRWLAALARRPVRDDERCERVPRHHHIHLRQKLPLARALGRQVWSQIGLVQCRYRRVFAVTLQAGLRGGFADLL